MRKTLVFLFVLTVFSRGVFPDSPYSLNLKADLIIGGAALGAFVPTLFFDPSPGNRQNKGDINFLDRSVMFSYSRTLDNISSGAAYALLVLPGISVLGHLKEGDVLLTYAAMYAEAFLLTWATKDLLKLAVARDRPYTYKDGGLFIPSGEEDDYYNSFPSGHTSFAFLGATFLTATFLAEYPDSRWKIPVIAGGYGLAAGVAVMRIVSGNHFITDVLAGAAIGSLYGWGIPWLHHKNRSWNRRDGGGALAVKPFGAGLMVSVTL